MNEAEPAMASAMASLIRTALAKRIIDMAQRDGMNAQKLRDDAIAQGRVAGCNESQIRRGLGAGHPRNGTALQGTLQRDCAHADSIGPRSLGSRLWPEPPAPNLDETGNQKGTARFGWASGAYAAISRECPSSRKSGLENYPLGRNVA